MIKVCPFYSDPSNRRYCLDSSCPMYYKEKDDCLIAAALKKYISEQEEHDAKINKLQNQMKAVSLGFAPFFPGEEKDWSGLQGGL